MCTGNGRNDVMVVTENRVAIPVEWLLFKRLEPSFFWTSGLWAFLALCVPSGWTADSDRKSCRLMDSVTLTLLEAMNHCSPMFLL